MKGRPTYTRTTVAWPNSPLEQTWWEEDIDISFEAKGGGTFGEFSFIFMKFSNSQRACQIQVFDDSINTLFDPRIQTIVGKLRRCRKTPSVEKFIDWLEEVGIRQSSYDKRGEEKKDPLVLAVTKIMRKN